MKIVPVYCSHCDRKRALEGRRGRLRIGRNEVAFRPDGAPDYVPLKSADTIEELRTTIVVTGTGGKGVTKPCTVFVRRPLPIDPDRALREARTHARERDARSVYRWTGHDRRDEEEKPDRGEELPVALDGLPDVDPDAGEAIDEGDAGERRVAGSYGRSRKARARREDRGAGQGGAGV